MRSNLLKISAVVSAMGLGLISLRGFADSSPTPSPSIPNDTYFSMQWALHNDATQVVSVDDDDFHTVSQKGVAGVDIGWLEAQSEVATLANNPVLVGVIDSGVDSTHPDLQGRISPLGRTFLSNPPGNLVMDTLGHGTQNTGIIVANSGNGQGIAGIAPSKVNVLPLKILQDNSTYVNLAYRGRLISDYAADAINYGVANGASVINISLGWPIAVDTPNIRKAIAAAVQAGVLIVASAGNDKKDEPTFPCSYEGVLCVGSVSNNGTLSIYSNYGGDVDILAPGDDIVSTFPLNIQSQIFPVKGYELMTGTSEAAPVVAAVAATLKSVYPSMTLGELKARLLVSAAPAPAGTSALYGLLNLKRALDAQPQPVFLPDFKSLDAIVINESDESGLQASGTIPFEVLWQSASGVNIQVTINGFPAGTLAAQNISPGTQISVPWTYTFPSLDADSSLNLTLAVSDSSGHSRSFTARLTGVRSLQNIATKQVLNVPAPVQASSWLATQLVGQTYATVYPVSYYPQKNGFPAQFKETSYNAGGPVVQIFDPSNPGSIQQVQIPNPSIPYVAAPYVTQVLQIDLNHDGHLDWVFITQDQPTGGNLAPTVLQFYLLNPQFQPLYGSASSSTWEVSLSAGIARSALKDYSAPGSWIMSGTVSGSHLLPAFLAQGQLPAPDNFNELDMRHYQSGLHLIYLKPQAAPSPQPSSAPPGFVTLSPRAIDNSAFWNQNPNAYLQNLINPSTNDASSGHLRVLVSVGSSASDMSSQIMILDTPTVTSSSLIPSSGWDLIAATGSSLSTVTQNTDLFFSFFDPSADPARMNVAWAAPDGTYLGDSEISYPGFDDPITDFKGAFDLGAGGKTQFYTSQFKLVGFYQASLNDPVKSWTLPLGRDSSFPDQKFDLTLSPVIVNSGHGPLSGVYMDSTLVRANMVSVAVLDPIAGTFTKPLRYSLQVSPNCAQLQPVQLTDQPGSIAFPQICASGAQAQIQLIRPGDISN